MNTAQWFSATELAGTPGMPKTAQGVNTKAKKLGWESRKRAGRGGGKEYPLHVLPDETKAHLLLQQEKTVCAPLSGEESLHDSLSRVSLDNGAFHYDADALWDSFNRKPEKHRQTAEKRLAVVHAALELIDQGTPKRRAFEQAAQAGSVNYSSAYRWYNKVKGYGQQDWLAALGSNYVGNRQRKELDPRAWDWFLGHWLTRKQPSFASSYRRLQEVATAEGWALISERALQLRVEQDVDAATIILRREGEAALGRMLPPMTVSKLNLHAGEAVSGDGLKFDKLWIDWGDETINTTTGWFWQDIYSGKIVAYRIAKTENTDLFRLATYDLTGHFLPRYIQLDNTRVAANKQMTAGIEHRNRFTKLAEEGVGTLLKIGVERVQFTNPDKNTNNPGVKPIERAFGIGGIHSEVATHPKFADRGYNKKTAIPADEFREVVAEEVRRHNARPNRRSAVCGGTMSFDQAFEKSFATAQVRTLAESQRRLLLFSWEKCKVTQPRGEIRIKAGAGRTGRKRYWTEKLVGLIGQEVQVYYDPEALNDGVAVYRLDGSYLFDADHQGAEDFGDTQVSREHHKGKQRIRKLKKKIAAEQVRMDNLEVAAMYPEAEEADVPKPGVVQGSFSNKARVDEKSGRVVGIETEGQPEQEVKIVPFAANENDGAEEDFEGNLAESLDVLRQARQA